MIVSDFNKKRWSKRELLELMLAQKKEIEELEQEVLSLKQEVATKEKRINEIVDLTRVTNKLVEITKRIDHTLKVNEMKEKG